MNRFRVNPLGQAWQDVGRFRDIVAVLVRYGFGELIARMNLQDTFVTRMLGHKPAPQSEGLSTPKRLLLVMQELGPTFIKLGQILSTRPDLIPEEFIEEFKTLQSSAAPLPFEKISAQLNIALPAPVDEIFDNIDPEPLASASIAQVHKATLKDGSKVVLKVIRPGIRETLMSDLSILKFFARQVESLFPDAVLFDPVGIAAEFEKALSKEIDFTVELRNLQRFTKNFTDNPDVHIPIAYPELSSKDVLVMERVEGQKITDVEEDREYLVRRMVAISFEMIYVHGFFHGDLHPGNIFVLPDGRIALIDFGLVGRLTPKMKDYVIDLLLGLVRHDYEVVPETLYEIGIKKVPVNYDRFQADVASLMDEYLLGAKMADIDFGKLIQELLDGAMRHHIAVPPDYTMMFKALVTVEGVGKQLDPELDLFKELEPYVRELVKQRYSPEELWHRGMRQVGHINRLLQQFPITARQVLLGIENGRIQFGLDERQMGRWLEEYRLQNARRLEVALSGIFMLMATLSLSHGTPTIFGLPTISFIGYLIGGGLAGWVMLNIMRDS
ncbi:MAG TPA: hypothetical protein DCE42_23485 [Myxococcales bacterium]|mgnify:CR=1 FL=1|nr:hypothetical protein [Deltaproteobacteria bacterium]HAA57750.1 hypothetical protein [Myxococcales bacterium]